MFGKIKAKFSKGVLARVLPILLVAEVNSTIDVSSITAVMTTLLYSILPILLIVMVFKIFGNLVKSMGDLF
jgi:hypothetical protein